MTPFRVGIIGCGRLHKTEGATGFGMAHQHAAGYKASPDVQIVAVCDIVPEKAKLFQGEHGAQRAYTDYQQMLREEKLDIVSICTWPHLHCEMVIAAAEAGVRAIHCEKPMAPTWGEARRMAEACAKRKAQLSFDHQRRFGEPFVKARELLKSGAIGQLQRLEASCDNLFDWGTHWFDMLNFYNDDTPAAWVIGQVELRGTRKIYAVDVEGQGLSRFKFKNGVYGLMVTGFEAGMGAENRLIGSEGVIEVGAAGGISLRTRTNTQSVWQTVACSENLHSNQAITRGIADLIDALKTAREPQLSARRALLGTELIFATYESSRRRGRVDLPLTIDDSPMADLLRLG